MHGFNILPSLCPRASAPLTSKTPLSARLPARFQHHQRRSFFPLPSLDSSPQKLHASRTLPYPSPSLYEIIADINSYSAFLPYCLGSTVSRWSTDAEGRCPAEAELRVGWGGFDERFVSRVVCVPGKVVEAVSGKTKGTISNGRGDEASPTATDSGDSPFAHLLTRWSVRPFPYLPPANNGKGNVGAREQTQVTLEIEFELSNPVYAALSKAVAPRVAGIMIEAFERRAKELLENPSRLEGDSKVESVTEKL